MVGTTTTKERPRRHNVRRAAWLLYRAHHPNRHHTREPVYYQEFFAPVALIFRVKDENEAIKLANDSPYGLGGSVITKNINRGKRIARQIDTGMVFINQATWTAPDLPFGGLKNSGYGRELAELGIGEFVNKKLIHVAA